MFAALSWLLDLDQGRSTTSSTSGSRSGSSATASEAGEASQPAPFAAVGRASGRPVAELQLVSHVGATAPSRGPSPTRSRSPRRRPLAQSFADLDARKATFFAPPACGESADDVVHRLADLAGYGATGTAASSQWGLRRYTSDAVRLSPIPTPPPAREEAEAEAEAALWVVSGDGAGRSPCRSPPHRGATPTRQSRILEWDEEVRLRRRRRLPAGPSPGRSGGVSSSSSSSSSEAEVPDVGDGAVAAATAPALPAVVRLHPSNPFLDAAAAAARDGAVPAVECEQPPLRQSGGTVNCDDFMVGALRRLLLRRDPAAEGDEDTAELRLGDGLVTVTSMHARSPPAPAPTHETASLPYDFTK
ncbi:hypothetical protein NESM_000295500 [Novymonas esmeraldas]|uniref:Uncharacterized protein n=1 Tax=Novymonas esmeraldas TaxID=1808958 RepID=A0AAW0F6J2_9TRYP